MSCGCEPAIAKDHVAYLLASCENKYLENEDSEFLSQILSLWDSQFKIVTVVEELQSEKVAKEGELNKVEETVNAARQVENLEFIDDNLGDVVSFPSLGDEAATVNVTPGIELGNFTQRPVLVKTVTWAQTDAVGATLSFAFDPWYEYFNNAVIKRKLDNYAFLRCKIRVKVLINASPFLYGSLMVTFNPNQAIRGDNAVTDAIQSQFVTLSQRPHIYVFPQTSHGGELVCPFIWPANYVDATSATQLRQLGTMSCVVMNPLRSANGVTGESINLQVWAEAEDLEFLGSTVALSVQSKRVSKSKAKPNRDDYPEGLISKPASAIAEVTGMLGAAPLIGPYMTATSAVASSIGSLAHLFGYTNTPNIKDVDPFRPYALKDLASSEISNPIEKLTLDPKNELTVDSRLVSMDGQDELDISYIVQRESFLCQTAFTTSNVVDDMLFNCVVTPNLLSHETDASKPIYYTPIGYLGQIFSFWRGDIIFRFKVICSQYHKARLRLTFDPNTIGDGIAANANNYNTSFNEVWDISAENDVSVRVPYMQALAWLQTEQSLVTYPWKNTHNSPVPAGGQTTGSYNGRLTLRVVNPLTAPVDTSEIAVQVFVKAADNFEYAYPREAPQNATVYVLQSSKTSKSNEVPLYDGGEEIVCGTAPSKSHPARYLINFGEKITSMRQVLRRSTLHEVQVQNIDLATYSARYRCIQNIYPIFYGYDLNGVHSALKQDGLTYAPFNYVFNTVFNWLSPMYVGQRGSMHWHYNVNAQGSDPCGSISAYKINATWVAGQHNEVNTYASGSVSQNASNFALVSRDPGARGMAVTNQETQAALSVSIPMMSNYKFHWTLPSTRTLGTTTDGSRFDGMRTDIFFTSNGKNQKALIEKYVSIGTDYNPLFFINVPPVYAIINPTPNPT